MKKLYMGGLAAFVLLMQLVMAWPVSAADLTTKFRVYEENRIVKEYATSSQAIAHASKLRNSHVEQIGTGNWVWDNIARYRVYQYDTTKPEWQFTSLDEAKQLARYLTNSSIRDVQAGGWVWHNYTIDEARYKLMQSSNFLPNWLFADLDSAKKEAAKWPNSHIIDLQSGDWVWDNMTAEHKDAQRAGAPVYQIYIAGFTEDKWKFGLLEDAVRAAQTMEGAVVYHIAYKRQVYANKMPFEVYQNGKLLNSYNTLSEALAYAKQWTNGTIKWENKEIWNNYPYFRVLQNGKSIKEFHNFKNALHYAMYYTNASIVTLHDQTLWDNQRELLFLAWNGSSSSEAIRSQVSQTMGLDIVSPTWFQLDKADGSLRDTSDPATVRWLKERQYAIHPLIHNQFDSKLTSAFLADSAAQTRFIGALVDRLAQLGVDGVNIDFESLAGKDRDAYTAFVRNLTAAAHAKGLTVSIDLPRGSVSWNHLTAFDHAKLADIVDYIITMTYDHHYSGSPTAGSVAGLQWVEQGIEEFLAYGIPRDKLMLGIPYYTREWRIDASGALVGNRALLLKDIPALLASKQTTSTWDERFNQYKITYQEDGLTRVFWLEDDKTIAARLELAKKYDLAGVAAWRLGHEDAAAWDTMIKNK